MTPQITISQSLYDVLKSLADPFTDTTPESVIARAVDFYRQNHTSEVTEAHTYPWEKPVQIFPPDGAPDLRFTKLTSVTLDGKPVAKSMLYWNSIMFELVQIAVGKLPPNQLRQAIIVNFIEGQGAKEKGYRYFPDAMLSVQGQDANQAWKATLYLAKVLHINLDVILIWEANDKAAYPGQSAQMTYKAV
jgi:hypothetical protein